MISNKLDPFTYFLFSIRIVIIICTTTYTMTTIKPTTKTTKIHSKYENVKITLLLAFIYKHFIEIIKQQEICTQIMLIFFRTGKANIKPMVTSPVTSLIIIVATSITYFQSLLTWL